MLEVSGGGDDRTDSETIAVADDDQPIGHAGHTPTDRGTSQMGEIDISENSIDGMGAIKFTDEEDCGYFGQSSKPCNFPFIGRMLTLETRRTFIQHRFHASHLTSHTQVKSLPPISDSRITTRPKRRGDGECYEISTTITSFEACCSIWRSQHLCPAIT